MIKEFKAFLMKGDLIEIAVALIMALAFKTVVDGFIGFVVTPLLGGIFGQPDFNSLMLNAGSVHIYYGAFLNTVISFITVGLVMFMVIKAYGRLKKSPEAATRECPHCLSEIPKAATRCSACTSQIEAVA